MGSTQFLLDPLQEYQAVGSLTPKAEMCTPYSKVKRRERGCKANAGVEMGTVPPTARGICYEEERVWESCRTMSEVVCVQPFNSHEYIC